MPKKKVTRKREPSHSKSNETIAIYSPPSRDRSKSYERNANSTPPEASRPLKSPKEVFRHKPHAKTSSNFGNIFFYVGLPALLAISVGFLYYTYKMKTLVITPLGEPMIKGVDSTSALQDPEKFWGTYRSNLYFGVKARTPTSPLFGLMWMPQAGAEMPPIRHWCSQDDGIPMYGWFAHDGINFGIQEIFDKYYILSTDFVKRPGGSQGGDWSARFRVNPRPNVTEAAISLFFYVTLDKNHGQIHANMKNKNQIHSISGTSADVGDFEVIFPEASINSGHVKYNHYIAYSQATDKLKEKLSESLELQTWDKSRNLKYIALSGTRLPPDIPKSQANFIVHQVTAQMPFEVEVLFQSKSFTDRKEQLKGDVFQQLIQDHLSNFEEKFENTFHLKSKSESEEHIHFAKAALSNMLGGIGYFHGKSLVRSKYTKQEVLEYWPGALYTGVPSRSFFPRGFLWDEGFHNLLIEKWDQTISMDIIGHWLDLMNAEGWIPREQILGSEARARVPNEFIVQHNENANPPTLFLPLQSIVKNLIKSKRPEDRLYLEKLYPRLKVWYEWFNTTQLGPLPNTYRWRGRHDNGRELNPKTLTSGLDDYPRASHPDEREYHLDLRCWMALASGIMADIARAINKPYMEYRATYHALTNPEELDRLHWSSAKQRYADYGLHTDHVKLVRPRAPPPKPGQRPNPQQLEKIRESLSDPKYQLVDSTFGYVSLFPFLLRIMDPQSDKLEKVLEDIRDPNLLWTDYGLRSLAQNSPLYKKHNTEHDPPYWRGSIWININYLAIGALHHYSQTPGPYMYKAKATYQELRHNVINNMYNVYRQTGYIWENYSDQYGKGKGCHPFTGWSALVVAILAEQY